MRHVRKLAVTFLLVVSFCLICSPSMAQKPKSKFYDFNEQLIDGQIKKPTTLYTDARKKVQFDRLLRLKKSFIPDLLSTAKDRVFR